MGHRTTAVVLQAVLKETSKERANTRRATRASIARTFAARATSSRRWCVATELDRQRQNQERLAAEAVLTPG